MSGAGEALLSWQHGYPHGSDSNVMPRPNPLDTEAGVAKCSLAVSLQSGAELALTMQAHTPRPPRLEIA